MRMAISLADEKLSAARYDAETDVCEIVNFDEGVDSLGMHFRRDASGRPELVHRDAATLHLHAGRDGLATIGEETDVSVEDLLFVALARVAEAVGAVSVVVFLGAPDPVLRNLGLRAGFEVRFIDPVDAAIRNWQFAVPEVADDAMDAICLSVDSNRRLTWDRRIATEDGAFVVPTRAERKSNGGCFYDEDIHSGIEVFVDWCDKTGGSRYLVVSGADTTTLPPDIVAGLENHYEGVFYADAVIGAASPPYPARCARFDEAVRQAIAAVDGTDFQTAIAKYEVAKAVFGDPPSDLEQLRLRIREALLKAGSVDTYELALALSENLPEKAAVHAECGAFYRKSGDVSRAEDEMLLAYYLDPEMYADNLSEGTSETPTGTSKRDIGGSLGLAETTTTQSDGQGYSSPYRSKAEEERLRNELRDTHKSMFTRCGTPMF